MSESDNLVAARDALAKRNSLKKTLFFENFVKWIREYNVLLPTMGEIHSFIANGKMKINFKCFESRMYKNRDFLIYILSRNDCRLKVKEKIDFYKLKFKKEFSSFEKREIEEKRFERDMDIHFTGAKRVYKFDKIKIPKIKIDKPKIENVSLKNKLKKNEFYEKFMRNQTYKQKLEPVCGCTKFDYCSTHYAEALEIESYRYTTNNLIEV